MAMNPLEKEQERGWGRDPAETSRVLECTGSWEAAAPHQICVCGWVRMTCLDVRVRGGSRKRRRGSGCDPCSGMLEWLSCCFIAAEERENGAGNAK